MSLFEPELDVRQRHGRTDFCKGNVTTGSDKRQGDHLGDLWGDGHLLPDPVADDDEEVPDEELPSFDDEPDDELLQAHFYLPQAERIEQLELRIDIQGHCMPSDSGSFF